jgi:uncharacterized protein YjbI with pentapeptide repeats
MAAVDLEAMNLKAVNWQAVNLEEVNLKAVNLEGIRSGGMCDGRQKIHSFISNNTSFRLKHPGVPDGSDGSDGTSYPLTENYTLPVTQATGRVA